MATRTQVIKQVVALPEVQVSSPGFLTQAKLAIDARARVAIAELEEKQARDMLMSLAESKRVELLKQDEYIGMIRIDNPGSSDPITPPPPVRIEFRAQNGSLEVSEEETLNNLFGALRPQLFEKAAVVTEIHDPKALVAAIQAAGHDPWALLNISVKPGMDSLVAKMPGLTAAEAILPKKGFMARLQEFGKNLKAEAKEYIRAYLAHTLKPMVIIGTKGKA